MPPKPRTARRSTSSIPSPSRRRPVERAKAKRDRRRRGFSISECSRIARCWICSTGCTRPSAKGASPTRGSSWSTRRSSRSAARRSASTLLCRAAASWRGAASTSSTIERGGDVTYHGPGQLVVYPIRRLERFREVVPLVRALEGAVIDACARFGVAAERWSDHAGVWVGRNQICAIGLADAKDGFAPRHRAQRFDRPRLRPADRSRAACRIGA